MTTATDPTTTTATAPSSSEPTPSSSEPSPPPSRLAKPFGNPLAHADPKIRLLNSALLLGLLHIGLFLWGNERATPLRLTASFVIMMALLSGVAYWRTILRKRLAAQRESRFPGATP